MPSDLGSVTEVCPDCGFDPQNCDCDEIDIDLLDCTHCGGSGDCAAGADPLWDCPEEFHACHACGGSGKRRDQRIF
jgi:hypothetical protein